MDIAKIRKKLRELEEKDRRPEVSGEPAARPDEKVVDSSVKQAPDAEAALKEGRQSGAADADVAINPEPGAQPEYKDGEEKAKPGRSETGEEIVEILTFGLMKEEFAFRVSHLEEILRHQQITRVPRVPKYILGITSLRGKVIPVIDLKLKLSLTDSRLESGQKGKILIIRGPKGPIGAAVDKVIGVVRIAQSEILPPPSHLSEAELRFVDGVAIVDKRFVSIINIDETVSLETKWT